MPDHSACTGSSSSEAASAGCSRRSSCAERPVEVTLVDRTNHHLFQPLLYQLATGILSEGEVAPPIRDILRRHANVTRRAGHGHGLRPGGPHRRRAADPTARVRTYPYDSLIVAAGARAVLLRPRRVRPVRAGDEDDRRRPRAARPDLRRLRDGGERAGPGARVARGSPSSWSAAARPGSRSPARSPSCPAQACRATSAGSTRPRPRSLLVDGGKEILATFGDRLSAKAAAELRPARRDDPHRVDRHRRRRLRGRRARPRTATTERIACRTKIWAAGVQASPLAGLLAEASGATCDRAGRIVVQPTTARCPATPRSSRSAT